MNFGKRLIIILTAASLCAALLARMPSLFDSVSRNLASREVISASSGYRDFPGPPCGAASGRLDRAQGWFDQTAYWQPQNSVNRIVPGQVAWLWGDCAKAIQMWIGQGESLARHPVSTFLAARGLYSLGDTAEAIQYFRQIDSADGIYELATKILNTGDSDQAARLYELAFAITPSVKAATQLAQRYVEGKQINRAIETWQAVADSATSDQADHWWAQAEIADLRQNRPEARRALERAVTLTTDPFPVYLRLGQVLMQMEDWSEALQVYQKAIALQPGSTSEPYTQAGLINAKLGNYASAMNWFDRGALMRPNDPWPNIDAGYTAMQFGDMPEAERRFRNALQQSPEHVGARLGMGLFLHQQNRIGEAIQFLEPIADRLDCNTLTAVKDDLLKLNLYERANRTETQLAQRCTP